MSGQDTLLVVEKLTPERRRNLGVMAATAGLDLHVIQDPEVALRWLERNEPRAVFLDGSLSGAQSFCLAVRTVPRLAATVLLVAADRLEDRLVEQYYAWGSDDVVALQARAPLLARLTRVGKTEPAQPSAGRGRAVVADTDPGRSHVVGRVLTQSGFDVAFVDSERGLLSEVVQHDAVLVVVNAKLGDVRQLVQAAKTSGSSAAWIVVCSARDEARHRVALAGVSGIAVMSDSAPVDGVLFITNRLLCRVVPAVRKTVRSLHSTVVWFRATGNSDEDAGLTYNVSAGGVFVRTLVPPTSQELWLELGVPRGQRRVRLLGRVAWRRAYGDREPVNTPAGFGVTIIDGLGDDLSLWQQGADALAAGETGPAPPAVSGRPRKPPRVRKLEARLPGPEPADLPTPAVPKSSNVGAPESSALGSRVPPRSERERMSFGSGSWFAAGQRQSGGGAAGSPSFFASLLPRRRRNRSPLGPMVAVTVSVAASIGAAIGGWYALEPRDSYDTVDAPVSAGAPLSPEDTGRAEQHPTIPEAPPPAVPSAASAARAPEAPGKATPPPAEPSERGPDAPQLAQLSAGQGYLWVGFPEAGQVYLNGVSQGVTDRWLKVKCGTWYVRVGDGSQVPAWLSAGRTVIVACGDKTRRSFKPASK